MLSNAPPEATYPGDRQGMFTSIVSMLGQLLGMLATCWNISVVISNSKWQKILLLVKKGIPLIELLFRITEHPTHFQFGQKLTRKCKYTALARQGWGIWSNEVSRSLTCDSLPRGEWWNMDNLVEYVHITGKNWHVCVLIHYINNVTVE